jgi:putative ABC transport system permease protein
MVRTAIKGVFANKVRLTLTALAIIIGVAFVAASYVFTDTIQAGFNTLLEDVGQGVDATVRPVPPEFGEEFGVQASMPEDVLDTVLAVEGVAVAEGSVATFASQVVGNDGEVVGGQGPPTLGFSVGTVDDFNPTTLDDGRYPERPGEVVVDVTTAEQGEFQLNQQITVIGIGGPEEFELVGIARFGEDNALLGATLTAFELAEAQRFFGLVGELSTVSVKAESGVTPEELVERISLALPEGVEAITSEAETEEAVDDVASQLSFLNIALLAFAGIAIFVGAFIISNTFRIIVAQRTRELALLRAVGATGSQVTWMVVIEAFLVALVASIIGVAAGVLLAIGLSSLLNSFNFNIPTGNLTVLPRTVIVGIAVGVVVTVLAALLPARRAASIPPVAAMHDEAARPTAQSTRLRLISGGLLTVLGLVLLGLGLFGDIANAFALVGAGALITFLGIAVLAYLAASPIAEVLGWPLPRLFGSAGKLAQENTKREPRRTATTASALMIGIALVVFVSVFAESIKESIEQSILSDFPADFTAASSNFAFGMPQSFTAEMGALEEIETVSAVQAGPIRVDGADQFLVAVEPGTVEVVFDLKSSSGALEALTDGDTVLVLDTVLEDEGLSVGDTIGVEYPIAGVIPSTIVGTFETDSFGGQPLSYVVSTPTYRENTNDETDLRSFALKADAVAFDNADAAVKGLSEDYASVVVETKDEFLASTENQINTILALFSGLLFLAIIIAILGIVNTLALSIYERTHEIGLLRAVGMLRSQVRRMIRWEAVIIALFGAVMGIIIGVVFGWAVVTALADEGLGAFDIPWVALMLYLVMAGLAGMVAAIYPSWKASRLNVLEAISYE